MGLIDKINKNGRNILAGIVFTGALIYSGEAFIRNYSYESEAINSMNSTYDRKQRKIYYEKYMNRERLSDEETENIEKIIQIQNKNCKRFDLFILEYLLVNGVFLSSMLFLEKGKKKNEPNK